MDDHPLTFDDARRIVETQAVYTGPGTFYVAPYGHVGLGLAQVVAGPREWLVDHDERFLIPNDHTYLVDLETGLLTEVGFLAVAPLLDDMEPTGPWPA